MSNNMLTTKEVTLLADLLTYEENACKKARIYAKSMMNKDCANKMQEIAQNHQKRFNELLRLL